MCSFQRGKLLEACLARVLQESLPYPSGKKLSAFLGFCAREKGVLICWISSFSLSCNRVSSTTRQSNFLRFSYRSLRTFSNSDSPSELKSEVPTVGSLFDGLMRLHYRPPFIELWYFFREEHPDFFKLCLHLTKLRRKRFSFRCPFV